MSYYASAVLDADLPIHITRLPTACLPTYLPTYPPSTLCTKSVSYTYTYTHTYIVAPQATSRLLRVVLCVYLRVSAIADGGWKTSLLFGSRAEVRRIAELCCCALAVEQIYSVPSGVALGREEEEEMGESRLESL